jgi:hypothetical protein
VRLASASEFDFVALREVATDSLKRYRELAGASFPHAASSMVASSVVPSLIPVCALRGD